MENEQQAVKKVKTYTERFSEVERQVEAMVGLYNEANQAFGVTASIVRDLSTQLRMINDQLQALYDLAESGSVPTRTNVVDRVNFRRVDRIQKLLDADEKAGLIKKVDSVQDENSIVLYTTPDVSLAFKAAGSFNEDNLPESLIGKKPGDQVGNVTISQVYEIVNTQQEAGEVNEQQKNG